MTIFERSKMFLLETLSHRDLFTLSLVLCIGIIFNDYIPGFSIFSTLLIAILFHQHEFKMRPLKRINLYFIGLLVASLVFYILYITTHSVAIQHIISSLSLFFLAHGVLHYFAPPNDKPYTSQIFRRINQMLIALGYVIVIYFSIFLIVYFIDAIFLIPLLNERLFFFASGVASLSFFGILFSVKLDSPFQPGKFFTVLFGTILPSLSLLCGVLAIVYLSLMLLGIRTDTAFLYNYYPYITGFYFFFIASTLCPNTQKWRKPLLSIFSMITIIAILYIAKRQWTIPAQQVSAIYALLCNGLFLGHNLYLLVKKKDFSPLLTKVTLLILVIIYTPLFGYYGYTEVVTYKGMAPKYTAHYDLASYLDKTKEKTALALKQEGKWSGKDRRPYQEREQLIGFHSSYESQNKFTVTGYNTLYTNLQLHTLGNEKGQQVKRDAYTITFTSDYRGLIVMRDGIELHIHDLYEPLKAFTPGPKEANAPEPAPYVIKTEEYLIYIKYYSLFKNNEQSNLSFDLLVK